MRCKDGGWKWVVARGMVVEQDGAGHALRMIGTHTDFTERRAAEEEMARLLAQTEQARAALREANDGMERQVRERTAQLELANKELEAFSYSVSHDLRSPLRGIDGWSLALQEDYGALLDDTGRLYLQRVRSESQRMGQLIDGMLEFSRLGRANLSLHEVDLSALAGTVAARIQEAHPGRAIAFHIMPGLRARCDGRLVEAVLHNLLENAVKFSAMRDPARIEFGQATPTSPRAGAPASVQTLFVRDNGAGFDMQHATKLFGVFQRLHKASEFPGTGIGLATVQRIIQRHGGEIWAASEPDAGATFYFTLAESPP
jgi:light-regulated signal transduction histidine kinase (bacteriophytochrome)